MSAHAQTAGSAATNPEVARVITKVREQAGLTLQEIAKIVGVGHRQVQNWAAGQGAPATNQRLRQLLDLQYVLDLVTEVYDEQGAIMWLHGRNRQLEGHRPLDLIAAGETDKVINLLDRLADGNF